MPRLTCQQTLLLRILGWQVLGSILLLTAGPVILRLTDNPLVRILAALAVLLAVAAFLHATWRMTEREIDQWNRDGRP